MNEAREFWAFPENLRVSTLSWVVSLERRVIHGFAVLNPGQEPTDLL
jgi:hypothetical protein